MVIICLSFCFSIESFTFCYRRFLNGPNFRPWFQRRRDVAEQEQQRLWRQARMNTDIQKFITKMSELEGVDSFNAIERHILGEIQVLYPTKIACHFPYMHLPKNYFSKF